MTLIISFFIILATLLAASVAGIKVPSARLSRYELKRLVGTGNERAIKEHHLEMHRNELVALRHLVSVLLLAISIIISILSFAPWIGVGVALIATVSYMPLARIKILSMYSQRYFDHHSVLIMDFIAKSSVLRAMLSAPRVTAPADLKAHSRDELLHLVDQSGAIINAAEKDMLLHGLRFSERTVDELMVPKSQIVTVKKDELLGPLVLDDLHKTGHNRFPVIDHDLNSIIGILHLRDLLTLDSGRTTSTAEKAMDTKVEYIHETDTLRQALSAFLYHHHHLLIVINKSGETVGLLTIEDVIEALFGRRLDDEFTQTSH
ncbi:CBS domain-containing protein [bacterium]|nr:MAG: CBS domain-containing protein [bacterium]